MSRNLLPSLRRFPNPANIPQSKVGEWSRVAVPGDLAKLDYGAEDRNEVRSQVQSIPSPWGRMLLFKNALESDLHPARELVEQELLDALEFLWSLGSMTGVTPRFERLNVSDLGIQAAGLGSQRAEDLANALISLRPRREDDGAALGEFAFESLVLVLVDGRPVLASSPFTLLFTAEDAASERTGKFFGYARGERPRRLKDRQPAFQKYVASVILPQLFAPASPDRNVAWATVKRLVKPWLEAEVRAAGLAVPGDASWQAAASALHLTSIEQPLSGVTLFRRDKGAEVVTSQWRLRSGRSDAEAPLVLVPGVFDGVFYEGAPTVTLPTSTRDLDRNVLPQLRVQYPWINPHEDWFTDRLLLLEQPVERERVHGFSAFASHYRGDDARLREPQMALPLRPQFFEHFSPDVVDEMLRIEIRDGGEVEVRLELKLGPDDAIRPVTIRRVYDATKIHTATGPSVSIWPSFDDARWRDYAIFRRDASADVARFIDVSASRGGKPIAVKAERRSDRVQVLGASAAPEVLELRSLVRGTGAASEDLGVLLPRFRPLAASLPARWEVGVDFGTSNTVVSVRTDGSQAAAEFHSRALLLPLTRQDDAAGQLQDAYFFPSDVRPGPFGTAVVHFRKLPTFVVGGDPLGVRVNIPFSGHVEGDDSNAVRGDLKWSAEQSAFYLTASFLRHLTAVVIAEGLQQGIDPARISIAWAYPRAFTPAQRNQLAQLWRQVLDSFSSAGLSIERLREPVDESRAVLRYFFNALKVSASGPPTAVLDVGGGTSDIAIYGNGTTLALDSVMLGGRNLTGQRAAAAADSQLRNPFVHALWRWAEATQLGTYPSEHRAVRKYLDDRQDHLAFTYLLGTSWFRANGQLFTGTAAFHGFQALVLYFYGSLFHYLGLSFQEIGVRRGTPGILPHAVLIGGNGSRYLHWLTDLTEDGTDNVFKKVLARILTRAAGVDPSHSSVRVPRVELSEHPKREVALGLVAPVDPSLRDGEATLTPLVGENLHIPRGEDSRRQYTAISRLADDDIVRAQEVSKIQWTEERLEIERFHQNLLEEIRATVAHGQQWPRLVERLREFLSSYDAKDIQAAACGKLDYLASANDGFRGSFFTLEAACMLDRMLSELFGSHASYTPPLGGPIIRAT